MQPYTLKIIYCIVTPDKHIAARCLTLGDATTLLHRLNGHEYEANDNEERKAV